MIRQAQGVNPENGLRKAAQSLEAASVDPGMHIPTTGKEQMNTKVKETKRV